MDVKRGAGENACSTSGSPILLGHAPPNRMETLHRLALPEAAKQDWLEEASRLVYPDARDLPAWRAFVDTSVRLARRHMPPGLAEFFSAAGPDAVLLENLPIDAHLPPPPSDGKRPASKSAVSESVIAGIIESHAAIVSYSNEKAGAPIHEITPVVGLEHVPSSAGRAPFACHTDAAFLAPRFSSTRSSAVRPAKPDRRPHGGAAAGPDSGSGVPGVGAIAPEAHLSPSRALQLRNERRGDRADRVV